MPVYNSEKYLKEAIDSILDQTYGNFEFIILDDGSTDSSVKIIESYDDKRIRFIKLNHGKIVKALNKGLEIAQGEYIVRFDSDDISSINRLQKLADFMDQNPEIAICGSWAKTINSEGVPVGEMKYPPVRHEDIKKYTVFHCPFIHPSVIIRKDILKEVGGYKKYELEDYELWTRILRKNKGYNIPENLINYRLHSNSMTENDKLKRKLAGLWVRVLALLRY